MELYNLHGTKCVNTQAEIKNLVDLGDLVSEKSLEKVYTIL
jgi:hypothetical protein